MAITEYGNTVLECLSTDPVPEKPDGWYMKVMDTGETYLRRNGEWTFLNTGLSLIKATKSGTCTTGPDGLAYVLFIAPFVTGSYAVTLSCTDAGDVAVVALSTNTSMSGFTVVTRRCTNNHPEPGITVNWIATRNYNE